MNKAEAVYEFINQFAYFACSGIIFMENYCAADNEVFKNLIDAFDTFMELHQGLSDLVEEGEIEEEAADSILKASIHKLRSRSVVKFFELVDKEVLPNMPENSGQDQAVSKILKKIKENKVTHKEFIGFMETLRSVEEKKKEATP